HPSAAGVQGQLDTGSVGRRPPGRDRTGPDVENCDWLIVRVTNEGGPAAHAAGPPSFVGMTICGKPAPPAPPAPRRPRTCQSVGTTQFIPTPTPATITTIPPPGTACHINTERLVRRLKVSFSRTIALRSVSGFEVISLQSGAGMVRPCRPVSVAGM